MLSPAVLKSRFTVTDARDIRFSNPATEESMEAVKMTEPERKELIAHLLWSDREGNEYPNPDPVSFTEDCGTGSGGFKGGNDCATGGGGSGAKGGTTGKKTADEAAQFIIDNSIWNKRKQQAILDDNGIDKAEFKKAFNNNLRDQREQRTKGKADELTRVTSDANDKLKSSLSPEEFKDVESNGMLLDRSPRQVKQYAEAASSWETHDPSKAAVADAVKKLKGQGVVLQQKGRNNSWYGSTKDGLSVRVSDHVGFDNHDVSLVFDNDKPPTRKQSGQMFDDIQFIIGK